MRRGPKGEKLTDAERHKRFVDMAKEVEASEDPKDFERAFEKVASRKGVDVKRKVAVAHSDRRFPLIGAAVALASSRNQDG